MKSENFDDGKGLNCSLKFTLPPNYPDEVPEIEIPENDEEEDEEVTNLEPEEISTLRDRLVSEVFGSKLELQRSFRNVFMRVFVLFALLGSRLYGNGHGVHFSIIGPGVVKYTVGREGQRKGGSSREEIAGRRGSGARMSTFLSWQKTNTTVRVG